MAVDVGASLKARGQVGWSKTVLQPTSRRDYAGCETQENRRNEAPRAPPRGRASALSQEVRAQGKPHRSEGIGFPLRFGSQTRNPQAPMMIMVIVDGKAAQPRSALTHARAMKRWVHPEPFETGRQSPVLLSSIQKPRQ